MLYGDLSRQPNLINNPFGTTINDYCGECGGNNQSMDCSFECNGTASYDECFICDGQGAIYGDTGCCELDIDGCEICMGNGCYEQNCTDWPLEDYHCEGAPHDLVYNISTISSFYHIFETNDILAHTQLPEKTKAQFK